MKDLVCDIKEFIAYEVKKLRNSFSGELVNQLKDENKFERQEIHESINLIKDVLEMGSLQQTQTQSSETNRNTENLKCKILSLSLHSPYCTRINSRNSYFTCWNK